MTTGSAMWTEVATGAEARSVRRWLRRVVLPMVRPAVMAAWLLVFLPSLRELSSSILLFTSRSRVVSVVIYTLYEEGLWEAVSSLGVLLLLITLVIVAVGQRLLGKRFLQI